MSVQRAAVIASDRRRFPRFRLVLPVFWFGFSGSRRARAVSVVYLLDGTQLDVLPSLSLAKSFGWPSFVMSVSRDLGRSLDDLRRRRA